MDAETLEVHRDTSADPRQVWTVLADGWGYAGWVVGASRIRFVDPTWPAQGARIDHSAGTWPLLVDDETEVMACEPEHLLVLQARGRPFGEARIEIALEPRPGGGCRVLIREDVTHGIGRLLPKPARQHLLAPRNNETLRRLIYLAERDSR